MLELELLALDPRHPAKYVIMSKEPKDELRPEYDFSKGVRGKYAKRYAEGTNIVRLDPDVAKAFPTAQSVNEALRGLMEQQSSTSK
jgi:hypothetical protein